MKKGDGSIFPIVGSRGKNRTVPIIIILVTCPSRTIARRIAAAVVTKRLAACVNLLPGIESTFRWEGKVDRAQEVLLTMKTTRRRFGALARVIARLHPYEVPEIIALPVTTGTAPYLRWVSQSVALR